MRPLLAKPIEPSHRLCRMGQVCQGVYNVPRAMDDASIIFATSEVFDQ